MDCTNRIFDRSLQAGAALQEQIESARLALERAQRDLDALAGLAEREQASWYHVAQAEMLRDGLRRAVQSRLEHQAQYARAAEFQAAEA